jgi:hypothetical protein
MQPEIDRTRTTMPPETPKIDTPVSSEIYRMRTGRPSWISQLPGVQRTRGWLRPGYSGPSQWTNVLLNRLGAFSRARMTTASFVEINMRTTSSIDIESKTSDFLEDTTMTYTSISTLDIMGTNSLLLTKIMETSQKSLTMTTSPKRLRSRTRRSKAKEALEIRTVASNNQRTKQTAENLLEVKEIKNTLETIMVTTISSRDSSFTTNVIILTTSSTTGTTTTTTIMRTSSSEQLNNAAESSITTMMTNSSEGIQNAAQSPTITTTTETVIINSSDAAKVAAESTLPENWGNDNLPIKNEVNQLPDFQPPEGKSDEDLLPEDQKVYYQFPTYQMGDYDYSGPESDY